MPLFPREVQSRLGCRESGTNVPANSPVPVDTSPRGAELMLSASAGAVAPEVSMRARVSVREEMKQTPLEGGRTAQHLPFDKRQSATTCSWRTSGVFRKANISNCFWKVLQSRGPRTLWLRSVPWVVLPVSRVSPGGGRNNLRVQISTFRNGI